jgi:hypothetical protein
MSTSGNESPLLYAKTARLHDQMKRSSLEKWDGSVPEGVCNRLERLFNKNDPDRSGAAQSRDPLFAVFSFSQRPLQPEKP